MGKKIPDLVFTRLPSGYIRIFDPWLKKTLEVPSEAWFKIALKDLAKARAVKLERAEDAKKRSKAKIGKQGWIDLHGHDDGL
jgi:hypothetical protein